MKKLFCLMSAVALTGVLALGVQAETDKKAQPEAKGQPEAKVQAENQPPHYPGDGHDHSPKKNPADETTTEYFWRKSDEAFHAGEYERAVTLHKAIVALDPSDVESYSVAAWLLWSMEKGDEAMAHLERGLKANPDDWQMWDAAGQHYDLQKRATPALAPKSKEAFARAVKLLPADADKNDAQMLRRRLAHAAEKAGDVELSLATWRDLVRDYPEDVVNKNNLARVEKLSQSGKLTAALPVAVGGLALLAMTGTGAMLRRKSSP